MNILGDSDPHIDIGRRNGKSSKCLFHPYKLSDFSLISDLLIKVDMFNLFILIHVITFNKNANPVTFMNTTL